MRQAQKQPPGATTPTPSALLLDDQDRRWQKGCRVPVESYLETSPWLAAFRLRPGCVPTRLVVPASRTAPGRRRGGAVEDLAALLLGGEE
jgi:hypothetical protein